MVRTSQDPTPRMSRPNEGPAHTRRGPEQSQLVESTGTTPATTSSSRFRPLTRLLPARRALTRMLRARQCLSPPSPASSLPPGASRQPPPAASDLPAPAPNQSAVPPSRPARPHPSRVLALLAALDAGVHLAACWWEPTEGTAVRHRRDVVVRLTQSLALPLMGGTWATWPDRQVRGARAGTVYGALAWSWLGDTLPALVPRQAALPVLVVSFLPAQWCWTAAMTPARGRNALRPTSPAWPLPLLGVVGAGVAVGRRVLPGSGALAPVGALYAVSLATQALAATGTGPLGAAGGSLFMLSDSLIAVQALGGRRLPKGEWLVMSTYLLAQALLLAAVEHDARRGGQHR